MIIHYSSLLNIKQLIINYKIKFKIKIKLKEQ